MLYFVSRKILFYSPSPKILPNICYCSNYIEKKKSIRIKLNLYWFAKSIWMKFYQYKFYFEKSFNLNLLSRYKYTIFAKSIQIKLYQYKFYFKKSFNSNLLNWYKYTIFAKSIQIKLYRYKFYFKKSFNSNLLSRYKYKFI